MDEAIAHLSESKGAIKMVFSSALYNLYFCKSILDGPRSWNLYRRMTEVELERCDQRYYGNSERWVCEEAGKTPVDHQMPTWLL